jgi:hypothetical protein
VGVALLYHRRLGFCLCASGAGSVGDLTMDEPEEVTNHWYDWLPETVFIALVIGGSFAWVLFRFWPEEWW